MTAGDASPICMQGLADAFAIYGNMHVGSIFRTISCISNTGKVDVRCKGGYGGTTPEGECISTV